MKRLHILTLVSLTLAACIFFFKKRDATTIAAGQGLVIPKPWLKVNDKPVTPKADVRPADQTFLTFPEWYLVFSPQEQADYYQYRTATTFPFMSHTAQIWESYKSVNNQIKDDFPVNTGYHFMIWVIGSSATAEYSVKALYETLVGRMTDTEVPVTAEDEFNAVFTQQYVDFIKDAPWYQFNFKKQLKALYTDVPFTGSNILRKLERRYILTSELLVKWGYGKLIGLGTNQVYETPLLTTAVVLSNDSLAYLPRYDKFTPAATQLAEAGFTFKEVAGNNSAILITILVPRDYQFETAGVTVVFTQPISSDRLQKRIALAVPIAALHTLLLQLAREKIRIEHVFDF
jgi:hypothetical protein